MKLRGYYAILDVPGGSIGDLAAAGRRAARLLSARPCCLQLRAKAASAAELVALGRVVSALARAAAVPLCINDRVDVALALAADAVHLGQEDLPLADARGVAGRRLAIGISTHDRAQAEEAMACGADYIGFGPVFPTTTKQNPDHVVGLERLAEICGLAAVARVPVIAIGGLSLPRMIEVAAAGAAGAALISAMEDAPDPALAGQRVNSAFATSPFGVEPR